MLYVSERARAREQKRGRDSRRQSDTERDRHIGETHPEGGLARGWNG